MKNVAYSLSGKYECELITTFVKKSWMTSNQNSNKILSFLELFLKNTELLFTFYILINETFLLKKTVIVFCFNS